MVPLPTGSANLRFTQRACGFGIRLLRRWHQLARALPLFLAFPLLLEPLSATVFLYRVTDDEILVGADSFSETDGIEQPPTAVKIHQFGSQFFAIQGKSRIGETKLLDLVRKTSGPGPNIEISKFASHYQRALTQWLAEVSRERPDLHRPYAANGIVVTSFQIFGFRHGTPFMDTMDFVTVNNGTAVVLRRQPMRFPKGKTAWIPAGVWTQGNPMRDFFSAKDAVGHMRFLFDREFQAPPPAGQSKVARPPLDILRITTAGAEWVQKKPQCPDISPYVGGPGSVALSAGR